MLCARLVLQRSGGAAHEHGKPKAGDLCANAIQERIVGLFGEEEHAPSWCFAHRLGQPSRLGLRGRKAKHRPANQDDAKGGDANGWAFE
jgi:hypothetical protein